MKMKLLAMVFLAGGSMFAQTRLSIGVGIGGYAPRYSPGYPSVQAIVPSCPGPDYNWVDGYWSQDYGRNTWVVGYWYRQPFGSGYQSGYQVAPRFDNRFNDRDDRRGSGRGFEQDRNQTRGMNQGQTRNRSNGHDDRQGNGFRGR